MCLVHENKCNAQKSCQRSRFHNQFAMPNSSLQPMPVQTTPCASQYMTGITYSIVLFILHHTIHEITTTNNRYGKIKTTHQETTALSKRQTEVVNLVLEACVRGEGCELCVGELVGVECLRWSGCAGGCFVERVGWFVADCVGCCAEVSCE